MVNRRRCIGFVAMCVGILCLTLGCVREPILHLHRENHINIQFPQVRLDLSVLWNYDNTVNWQSEWMYGWDVADQSLFGEIGYHEPTCFEVRRYFTGDDPNASHDEVSEHFVKGNSLVASYKEGYYDILAWNDIQTPDGIQSVILDESSSLDRVTARTNQSTHRVSTSMQRITRQSSAYYQPEELFAAYVENLLITKNPEDYDYYDEELQAYVKRIDAELNPLVYIYLIQVILHNNNGKITGVDGNGSLSGMSIGTCLNNGVTDSRDINVYFNTRFKKGVELNSGETVDICGARTTTFGMCNMNPFKAPTRQEINDTKDHSVEMNFQFSNGRDSTMIFDVTKQVRQRYRGGVLTIELDMDTVPLPYRSGGSSFDPVVEDFEDGGTHEFEM